MAIVFSKNGKNMKSIIEYYIDKMSKKGNYIFSFNISSAKKFHHFNYVSY